MVIGLIRRRGSGDITISWPETGNLFELESTATVAVPGSWIPVPEPPTFNNGTHSLTLPTTDARKFYRLKSPQP